MDDGKWVKNRFILVLLKNGLNKTKDEKRRKPHLENGKIDPKDFGKWTEFTECLANVMKIIEGVAYRPEAPKDRKLIHLFL